MLPPSPRLRRGRPNGVWGGLGQESCRGVFVLRRSRRSQSAIAGTTRPAPRATAEASCEPRLSGRIQMDKQSPMRIRLAPERRASLLRATKQYFLEEFDEALSDFRAEGLLAFFVRELGPPVYNQGVRDASAYMHAKLGDIEGDVYERE